MMRLFVVLLLLGISSMERLREVYRTIRWLQNNLFGIVLRIRLFAQLTNLILSGPRNFSGKWNMWIRLS